MRNAELTAVVKRDGDWWLGWVEEIPGANAQEKSREELIVSLKEAARDIIELNRAYSLAEASGNYEEVALAI
jgi:predicted RNase H-like HicB family nuclease